MRPCPPPSAPTPHPLPRRPARGGRVLHRPRARGARNVAGNGARAQVLPVRLRRPPARPPTRPPTRTPQPLASPLQGGRAAAVLAARPPSQSAGLTGGAHTYTCPNSCVAPFPRAGCILLPNTALPPSFNAEDPRCSMALDDINPESWRRLLAATTEYCARPEVGGRGGTAVRTQGMAGMRKPPRRWAPAPTCAVAAALCGTAGREWRINALRNPPCAAP
jgi:hypothetical protein